MPCTPSPWSTNDSYLPSTRKRKSARVWMESRRRSVRRLRRVNIAEHPRARRTVGASAAESECGRVYSTISIIRCATIPIYGSTFIHTYIRQYHVNRARAMSFVEQSRQERGADWKTLRGWSTRSFVCCRVISRKNGKSSLVYRALL